MICICMLTKQLIESRIFAVKQERKWQLTELLLQRACLNCGHKRVVLGKEVVKKSLFYFDDNTKNCTFAVRKIIKRKCAGTF